MDEHISQEEEKKREQEIKSVKEEEWKGDVTSRLRGTDVVPVGNVLVGSHSTRVRHRENAEAARPVTRGESR